MIAQPVPQDPLDDLTFDSKMAPSSDSVSERGNHDQVPQVIPPEIPEQEVS